MFFCAQKMLLVETIPVVYCTPRNSDTAGFASLCTEVNTLSRNNQSTLTVFDTIFRKLLLYAFALLRFWNMLYERKRSPWTSKMAGDEVRLREQLRPESTSRVAIPASSAPQRALAPAM